MKQILFLFIATFLLAKESCLLCHKNYNDLDRYHTIKEFGCISCHGGNGKAKEKTKAHQNIVKNPARLEHAKIFCSKCHKNEIERIAKSLMNTQSGILDVLRFQFKKPPSKSFLLEKINNPKSSFVANGAISKSKGIKAIQTPYKNLVQSHFAKLCAACHINEKQSVFKTIPKRGGGCIDCHEAPTKQGEKHIKFTTIIPDKNCLKCHNRSNRIGLSFHGIYESEGYNRYKNGKLSNKLDKYRRFIKLPADIHHSKGKMLCIDCHTEVGIMGDNKEHLHMEEAVDISCIDCHKPIFKKATNFPLATKLAYLNGKVPLPKDKVAITHKKGTPIYNLQKIGKKIVFFRKSDGKALSMPLLNHLAHQQSFHKRLDCSACHSKWIPSCYGCHEIYFENARQFDWIKLKKTHGQWMELRNYLRFEDSTLAIGYNNKIMPTAPGCQVFMNIFDKNNSFKKSFISLAYGAWNPHTTNKSKKCITCHFNSSSLGFGKGIMHFHKNKLTFIPFYDSNASSLELPFNIDALNSINGEQLQGFSRKNARSFNKEEITKIINVYKCAICHNKWSDPIYEDFNKSKKLFYQKQTSCAKRLLQ